MSRDTVREAIRELAEAGYLVSKRGRYGGTFVTDPVPVALADRRADRRRRDRGRAGPARDPRAGCRAGAAARTLSAAERDLLWTRLRDAVGAPEDDYRRLDSRLHLTIGELVGTPSLVSLLADNRTRVNELLDRIPLLTANIAHSNQQHEAIVIAILTGDSDGAAAAMREHLEGSNALLRGFLG